MKNSITLLLVSIIITTSIFAQRGKDGSKIISASEVVNAYTFLMANANIGATTITVVNSNLNTAALGNLAQGDLIMIIQVQGASVEDSVTSPSWPNSSKFWPSWGGVTNYNNCGNHEMVQVESVPNGTTINLSCGLTNNYTSAGKVEVIRVPRYSDLTITGTGILTSDPWNGFVGGIVAVEVLGLTDIQAGGEVDVSGLGFRGGQTESNTVNGGLRYADGNAAEGAEKGESIAGSQSDYDGLSGRYCKGSAANGGGGGNGDNCGGGGGSNAGNLTLWNNGIGNPDVSDAIYISAWGLDTGMTNVNTTITAIVSSGGGRGGYSNASNNSADVTVHGPNHTNWNADWRRDNGGLGGRPLDYTTGKIFMGGAGGAGERNTEVFAGPGGNASGIVYFNTYGNISGAGLISANGDDGGNCQNPNPGPFGGVNGNDAAGGAGAGGAVILKTTGTVSGIIINADGGKGGNQVLKAGTFGSIGTEAQGPGGGGGGGYIAISNGTPTRTAIGGGNGTTNSTLANIEDFSANGATIGGTGLNNESIDAFEVTANGTSICENLTATLTAITTGTAPAGLTIQWYDEEFGGSLLFTGATYTTPVLTTTDTFWVKPCPSTYLIPVIVTVTNCGSAPVASFSSSDSTLCVGDCISFTDLSTNTPTSWVWHFFGADSTTSTLQNPTNICFSGAGNYNVALVSTNASGQDSLYMANFITVTANDNATYSYANASYCQNGLDPTPTITGTTGGTFTSTAGLSLNATNGEITLATSTPATYGILYTTLGICADTLTVYVTINASEDATTTYTVTNFCQTDSLTPTITGTTGGTFTSTPAGLNLNSSTGQMFGSLSNAGTYAVLYTTPGTCFDTLTTFITVDSTDSPNFNYPLNVYCQTDSDPTPTITGNTGGTFTSAAGLSLNATTGEITLATSTPATYGILYTTPGICADTLTVYVTINASEDATTTYTVTNFCQTDSLTPTITGTTGGTFTSTPVGLDLNSSTGQMFGSLSNAGTYAVLYTTPGTCFDTLTTFITVDSTDSPNFNYPLNVYCQTDSDPTPTITGNTGGSFTSAAGLSLNATTGEITLATSTPATYGILYTTSGTCSDTLTVFVTINACTLPVASFSATDSTICENDCIDFTDLSSGGPTDWTWYFPNSSQPVVTGTQNPTNICYSSNGTFDVSLVATNSFGQDSIYMANFITVTAIDDATYSYANASYCQTDSDPTPIITGTIGGTFTSAAGLSLNATTGEITLATSTPATYGILYTTPGTCSDTLTVYVTINASEDATTTYTVTNFCQTDSLTPTITGTTGGTFTSTPAGLNLNSSTGQMFGSLSNAGTYAVLYTTPGTCFDTLTTFITVDSTDSPNFNYPLNVYCQTDSDPTPTITGNTGGTFTSAAGLSLNATTGEITLATSTPATYGILYTTAGTCSDTLTVYVTINACTVPVASFSATDSTICENDCIDFTDLSSGGPTDWTWYFPNSTQPVVTGIQNPTNICYSSNGTFDVSLVATNSFGQDSIYMANFITVNVLPTITASADTSICSGDNVSLSATGGISYIWDNTLGAGQFQTPSPIANTTYKVVGTDANGCSNTDSVQVTVTNCSLPPVADFSANTTLCINDCISFTDLSTNTPTTWAWSFSGTDTVMSTQQNPTNICYDTTGVYQVSLTVTNINGSDTKTVTNYIVVDSCNVMAKILTVPNIFTPNHDGMNDLWMITGGDIQSNNTSVFNRWGELLFESNSINKGWDGRTTSGIECPAGTYFYIINLKVIEDGKEVDKLLKGTLLLTR